MPDVFPVFPEYDIELQAKCMKLVRARTDVPAPEVRWVELDPQWLGTPFLVMRRIDGDAPPDIPPYVFDGLGRRRHARAARRDADGARSRC